MSDAVKIAQEASGGSPVAFFAVIVAFAAMWLYWSERARSQKLTDQLIDNNKEMIATLSKWQGTMEQMKHAVIRVTQVMESYRRK